MENSPVTISGHWAYNRYWTPTIPKKPNNENNNLCNFDKRRIRTGNKRKTSRKTKTPSELTCSNGNSKNTTLKGVEIIFTEGFNSAPNPSGQIKHGHTNIIYNLNAKPSKYMALDCEMVAGVGYPPKYKRVCLAARISMVNEHLECVYNKYVKPMMKVFDYGTRISGVTKHDLDNYGEDFCTIQREVASILKDKILIGHAVHYDMNVLYVHHPKNMIRDTADYEPLTKYNRGKTPSLKVLAKEILGLDIQEGAHDSIIDASASMQLYLTLAEEWEAYIVKKEALILQMNRLKDEVWYDKKKYSDAECRYYRVLAKEVKASKSEKAQTGEVTLFNSGCDKTISKNVPPNHTIATNKKNTSSHAVASNETVTLSHAFGAINKMPSGHSVASNEQMTSSHAVAATNKVPSSPTIASNEKVTSSHASGATKKVPSGHTVISNEKIVSSHALGATKKVPSSQTVASNEQVLSNRAVASNEKVTSSHALGATNKVPSSHRVASNEKVASSNTLGATKNVHSGHRVASNEKVASSNTLGATKKVPSAHTVALHEKVYPCNGVVSDKKENNATAPRNATNVETKNKSKKRHKVKAKKTFSSEEPVGSSSTPITSYPLQLPKRVAIKKDILKELSSLERGITYNLKNVVEHLENSVDYIAEMHDICAREKISKEQLTEMTKITEMDLYADDICKLVDDLMWYNWQLSLK